MRSKLLKSIFIGTGATTLAVTLWLTGVLDKWEFATWDWRVNVFAHPSSATPKIKVILLDQASLDWGKNQNEWSWPWPREAYTPIIDFCRRGGAKTVAFDVFFTESSMYGVGDDSKLAAAIRNGPPFVNAVMFYRQGGGLTAQWPDRGRSAPVKIQGMEQWLSSARGKHTTVYPRASFPTSDLIGAIPYLGSVAGHPEGEVILRTPVFAAFDNKIMPSLWLSAYLAGAEQSGNPVGLRINTSTLKVNSTVIPIDKNGMAILRYGGSWNLHRPFSAVAVIQSELRCRDGEKPSIDPSEFKDCYVFFGFSAPGLKDLRPTPLCDDNPGVEIHATALDNLLSGGFLKDVPAWWVALFTLVLALLSSLLVIYSKKTSRIVIVSVIMAPIGLAAGFLAYQQGYWMPVLVTSLSTVVALIVTLVYDYQAEGKQKAFIKQAFKHYLGAEVIEQLITDPSRLKLGGERRQLTLFFSDIEKFSSFSERLDPPTLTALLNDFLSDMTDIILKEGGYLDKYIGDSIVAFWNAPITQQDHAVRACRAAVLCQRKLAARRQEFFNRTGVTIKMRMGINTGDVVVGNMGSRERFNYTVLGDAANLASRLEGANKAFGTYLMVSGATWDLTEGKFIGREMGRLTVVGRKEPVKVYELSGLAGDAIPGHYALFNEGLQQFYKGGIAGALKIFESIKDDPVSGSYCVRCGKVTKEALLKWDGVLNLTEK